MRWLVVLLFAGAGVVLGAAGLLLLRDDGPGELLPDLDQALPSKLEIVEDGDTYRLVFASAVDNVGAGPLLLEGTRPERTSAAMAIRQLVRRTDGSTRSRTLPGELTYATSETQAQWRPQGFESYELRRVPGGERVRPDRKTGFCLGDRYETAPGEPADGKPDRPVWTDECGRDQPALLLVREGYLLVHRTNPGRTIEESDYDNNAASVLIQLRRAGAIPSVRVLARCPDAETCARS